MVTEYTNEYRLDNTTGSCVLRTLRVCCVGYKPAERKWPYFANSKMHIFSPHILISLNLGCIL